MNKIEKDNTGINIDNVTTAYCYLIEIYLLLKYMIEVYLRNIHMIMDLMELKKKLEI